jgi:hypothetical protein
MSPLYFITQYPFKHWDLLPPQAHCVLLGQAVQHAKDPHAFLTFYVRKTEAEGFGPLLATIIGEETWVQLTTTHHPIISW